MRQDVFFSEIRKSLFARRMSQQQIDGIKDVLTVWDSHFSDGDIRYLAYIFATVFHETGAKMIPVREGFAKNDAEACRAVKKLYDAGRISTNYACLEGGVAYFGRGRVQNTWLKNYQKLQKRFNQPFVKNPNLLLDSKIDALVTVIGHVEGIWTGKRLYDYFNDTKSDAIGARKIINGVDKAKLIAGYYEAFLDALEASESPTQESDTSTNIDATGKKPLQSTTVLAAGATGAATFAQAINAVMQPINDAIIQTKTTADAFSLLLSQPKVILVVGLGALGIFAVWWIIKERMRHSYEQGV